MVDLVQDPLDLAAFLVEDGELLEEGHPFGPHDGGQGSEQLGADRCGVPWSTGLVAAAALGAAPPPVGEVAEEPCGGVGPDVGGHADGAARQGGGVTLTPALLSPALAR